MRAPSTNARRPKRTAVIATVAAVVLAAAASAVAPADARLSVLPRRPGAPRPPAPSPTPQAVGSVTACQETLRGASAELAASVRAALGECLRGSLPCIFEAAGSAACCASAAPVCVSRAEDVAAAGAAFVADVVGPACGTVPFDELAAEGGLDVARPAEACLRLDRPVAVDGLGSLATCLERLVTEDVVHLVSTTEQPRALEALVCMDLEDRFPGVLRERPATCEDLPAATPSPAPTTVPTPTPEPTPGGSPGAPTPTPTPGGTSPTPQPTAGGTCTQVDLTIAVQFDAVDFPDMAGITTRVRYPASVSIPGVGSQPTVLERTTNLTAVQGALFSAGDEDSDGDNVDDRVNVGLISPASPIPPGDFARVRFDCATGAGAPAASAFSCVVEASTASGNEEVPTQCVLTVSVP